LPALDAFVRRGQTNNVSAKVSAQLLLFLQLIAPYGTPLLSSKNFAEGGDLGGRQKLFDELFDSTRQACHSMKTSRAPGSFGGESCAA
jgi:hypothetical protein